MMKLSGLMRAVSAVPRWAGMPPTEGDRQLQSAAVRQQRGGTAALGDGQAPKLYAPTPQPAQRVFAARPRWSFHVYVVVACAPTAVVLGVAVLMGLGLVSVPPLVTGLAALTLTVGMAAAVLHLEGQESLRPPPTVPWMPPRPLSDAGAP